MDTKWDMDTKTAVAIATAVAGLGVWMWRHGLAQVIRYFVALAKMPLTVEDTNDRTRILERDGVILRGKLVVVLTELDKPVWESDAQGRCIWCNSKMLATLRRPADHVLGDSWRSIIAQEDRDRVTHEWESCIAQGRNFDLEYSWLDVDGKRIPIHAVGHVIRDGSGRVMAMIGIVTLAKNNL